MSLAALPPYVARTFLEHGAGFHFSAAPPPDIRDHRYLSSADPWEVLACTLANLQHGHFGVAAAPIDLMSRYDDLDLWAACANLIGFAAPAAVVRSLFEVFAPAAYDDRRLYPCSAAVAAGGLWAVDPILGLYPRADPHLRDLLQDELSWLLEPAPGRLWAGPERIEVQEPGAPDLTQPEPEPDIAGYVDAVRACARSVREALGPDRSAAVAEGRPIAVRDLAKTLLDRLRQGERSDRIDRGRMLLEASTGLDCHGFFDEKYMLQPLAAAAIVEDFLESDDASRYLPGVRYFFGHRIPD